jgi:hypothetical protein
MVIFFPLCMYIQYILYIYVCVCVCVYMVISPGLIQKNNMPLSHVAYATTTD